MPEPESHRIVVLPLVNISADPKDEYFADGMTEELISTLSRLKGLRVIARTSAMRYRGTTKSVAEIGRELQVTAVLEGSVRRADNRVRIAVQLIDARTEEHLWAQEYDREFADVFAIQRDIAQRIAKSLRVKLPRGPKDAPATPATTVMDAYTLYLKGRYLWNQRTDGSLKEALAQFEAALEQDPKFALAQTGVADAYAVRALLEFVPPSEAFPRARRAAERALELDPQLAEAHASLGLVEFQYARDWPAAERELGKAVELDPQNPLAHQYFADYLKAMGRFDEALEQMQRALELDPLSLGINTGLGHVLYLSRQYDRAIEQYRKALALDPNFVQAHLWFGRPFLEKGMFAEAIAELREAVRLSGGSTISLAVLGHALASAGQRPEAERILAQLVERGTTTYVPSYWIGLIYTGLGDNDQALHWLERAYAERSSWLAWIKVEPRFDRLRDLPRFRSLLTRMRLEGGARAGPSEEEMRRLRAVVSGLDELRLPRYRVIGRYTRWAPDARHRLKDLATEIGAGLRDPNRPSSFLLWAPPGSGKSYFVQETGRNAEGTAELLELNLAAMDEASFRAALKDLAARPEPLLVLIDEVDSQPSAEWPYEMLLPVLEPRSPLPAPRVYVLVGSTGGGIEGLREGIRGRPKGDDLLSRIPPEHQTALPAVTAEDRLIVAASTLLGLTQQRTPRVSEVEKLALYYLAVEPELASPRRIRDQLTRAVGRIPPGEDRLKFDHLFQAGDAKNKEFWMAARAERAAPLEGYVAIEGG